MLPKDFGNAAESFLTYNMPLYRPANSSPLRRRLFREGFQIPSGGNCIARALLVLALSEMVKDTKGFLDITLNKRNRIIHAKAGLNIPDSHLDILVDTGATGGLLGFGTVCIKYADRREVRNQGPIRFGREHRILKPEEVNPTKLGIRTPMSWPEMSGEILNLANIAPATPCYN